MSERDAERAGLSEAMSRASGVFGWQHLARYSGQTSEWLDLTLGAMARAVREGDADRLAAAVARAERAEAKVAAVEHHRIVAAGPAYVMCACDMQRRDVPTYDAHLRAALTSPHPARDEHTSAGGACPTCGPTSVEQHPRRANVTRCANCKEWLTPTDTDQPEHEEHADE